MRKLIAGMKVCLDQKMEGPDGHADLVDAWSENFGLTPQFDVCLLGEAGSQAAGIIEQQS